MSSRTFHRSGVPRSPRSLVTAALLGAVTILASLVPVAAVEPPDGWSASGLTPDSRVTGFKSVSADLAKSDPALVKRTDGDRVNVVIKLDYDAVASYSGGIADLAPTSPLVTGKELTGKSRAEVAYGSYIKGVEADAVAALKQAAPSIRLGSSLRTVYGGIAASLRAREVKAALKVDGVVAVQADELHQLLTDSSSDFINATKLQKSLGGRPNAGAGVIYGNLDSGVWPEHPSFADQGNLGAPPPKADGTARTCDFGDNPLTPASDPFSCANKLIGGRAFLATYLSNPTRAADEPYHTARDSNGHGTHTASTSAGNALSSATVFGVERGPINGIAPGAWLSVYKVCGIDGCFASDSAAAVQQAIKDGVDVINFSISGGTDPFTDPVELAFLDAYAAGVFVSTSAGNDGPGAETANHLSPWVTTVAASTQTREFASTLSLTAGNGDTFSVQGASITAGAGPLPVVMSSAAPYSKPLCDAPAAPGTFTGKIVACQRGTNARVEKGYNVFLGGAAGMILYNPTLADIETDNHWLPTVHLADGTGFVAFMGGHTGVTGSFTAGQPQAGQGDIMAAFSSRGPAGLFIKPDVTAPGVQILAGMTPTPETPVEGPPGEYFQAIAGTSMSSPHTAGAAILLADAHPTWTPGQIKSALMTSSVEDVLKEDLTTPADPFDRGAGRIDVHRASSVPLTFDESADRYFALGADPLNAIHLNLPSINAPVLPGEVTTTRTLTNTTDKRIFVELYGRVPAGSKISISPKSMGVNAGQSATFTVKITTDAPQGAQQFGSIRLAVSGVKTLHMPIAFVHRQGEVSLEQSCLDETLAYRTDTTCTVVATNLGATSQAVSLSTVANSKLKFMSATGATISADGRTATGPSVTLAGNSPGVPSIGPGATPAGFLPLALFGIAPTAVGDEEILNFNVPTFQFNGVTYNRMGVDSNGYLVAGGETSEDNNCCNLPTGPSAARPNNVIAPFWTDLDGTGAPGISVGALTDGVSDWVVFEWEVNVWGTTSSRHFQVWIGVNGVQDLSFAYDPAAMPADPDGQDFLVGAENELGQGEISETLPTEDLVVTSTNPTPGESASYTLVVRGQNRGVGTLTTTMDADGVLGRTIVKSTITVE